MYNKLIGFGQGYRGFPSNVSGQYWRMLYFSTGIATSSAFGDIVPVSTQARSLVTLEALLAVVFVGLFLNSLAYDIGESLKNTQNSNEKSPTMHTMDDETSVPLKITSSPKRTKIFWVFIVIGLVVILVVFASIQAYQAFAIQEYSDLAGWLQVVVAVLGVPIIYWELNQIRQAVYHKPIVKVGLGNVNDLPLSKLREKPSLLKKIAVDHGYPQFWLIVRNQGKVAAKSVKIHIEFIPPKTRSILSPVIEVSDWLGDDRFTFKKVNNADFVFIGGQDWVLHANDTDMFDFYMSTALVKQTKPKVIREHPDIGDYEFHCTVWADGLDTPVKEILLVSVVESLKR